MPRRAPIHPPALLPGDTIGIVAPASNIDRNALLAGCSVLERMGYVPYYRESIVERDLYFAGSVERRVAELEHMFANSQVRAVLCARGGYGTNYLLPRLNMEKLLKNPKPFIGYSDNTTLLTWMTDNGLVTFHGPMLTKDFSAEYGVDDEWWKRILSSTEKLDHTFASGEMEVLNQGKGEGILYGGCLSMLVASLGTAYELQTEGTILFLEDMNEKPYQIDRMLMHLRLAGKLKDVRGFIFGEMLECAQPGARDYSLQDVLRRVLGDLDVPVVYGLASGHVHRNNRVLPLGVKAKLDAGKEVRLQMDSAVTSRQGGAHS